MNNPKNELFLDIAFEKPDVFFSPVFFQYNNDIKKHSWR